MPFTIDPTLPASNENIGGGLGASRIQEIASWLLQMFGYPGVAAVTQNTAPFTIDTNGNVTANAGMNVSSPTTSTQAANKSYVDAAVAIAFSGVATNVGNAYSVTLNPVPSSQAALTQRAILVQLPAVNTGAATLNVNGFGAQPLLNQGVALIGNELAPANGWFLLTWDGVNYQLTTSNATTIQTTPVSTVAPTSGQTMQYVAATGLWTPSAPVETRVPDSSTTLTNTTVVSTTVTTIYTVTSTTPNVTGQKYLGLVNFSVFYSAAAGVNTELTCQVRGSGLSSANQPVFSAVTNSTALVTNIAGTVLLPSSIPANTAQIVSVVGAATATRTANLVTGPSTIALGGIGGIWVTWIPSA